MHDWAVENGKLIWMLGCPWILIIISFASSNATVVWITRTLIIISMLSALLIMVLAKYRDPAISLLFGVIVYSFLSWVKDFSKSPVEP
ncbi:MAG: hypothetical protein RRC34_16380 [Lentisphaeria bacterium]|nr:hypothetical protein [Lentisphaeria bacterium]